MVTQNSVNEPTAASGKVLQGQGIGTASAFSTATYPSTATGTGTILRADGTNWVATTSTYPNTNAVSTLLYASSANVMGALATANSGRLQTDASGVPSIVAVSGVRARKSGNTANATGDGTNVTIVYDTVEFDLTSNYNNSTGTFTCPTAGYYSVCAFILMNSLGSGHTAGNFQILVNGTVTTAGISANAANMRDSSNNLTWQAAGILKCAVNDAITIRLVISNSTKTVQIQGGGVGNGCVQILQLF